MASTFILMPLYELLPLVGGSIDKSIESLNELYALVVFGPVRACACLLSIPPFKFGRITFRICYFYAHKYEYLQFVSKIIVLCLHLGYPEPITIIKWIRASEVARRLYRGSIPDQTSALKA